MAYKKQLKCNGIKCYKKINDLLKEIDDELDKKCFKEKNATIIRLVVNNPKIKDVIFRTYTKDYNYSPSDNLSVVKQDTMYGTCLEFTLPINDEFVLYGCYDWHTPKVGTTNQYRTYLETFSCNVRTINGKNVFSDTMHRLFNNTIFLKPYLSVKAIEHYKTALSMNRIFYGNGLGPIIK